MHEQVTWDDSLAGLADALGLMPAAEANA